eukprot:13588554-Alexandrium_andersonii.AAC.1
MELHQSFSGASPEFLRSFSGASSETLPRTLSAHSAHPPTQEKGFEKAEAHLGSTFRRPLRPTAPLICCPTAHRSNGASQK